jgi:phosphoribosyl-ATP pyrophosphohydrolase
MIDMLLQQHRRFMDLLGIAESSSFKVEELLSNEQFIAAAVGLIAESTEVLNDLNTSTRPWKATRTPEEKRASLVEEIIDVFFYLLEIMSMVGMTEEEVMTQYGRKLLINLARICEKKELVGISSLLALKICQASCSTTYLFTPNLVTSKLMREALDGCSELRNMCALPIL